MRRSIWIRRLAEGVDLPEEGLPGEPIVEILGRGRILIEHHSGVTEYGKDRIQVKMSYGYLVINGCGLELARMSCRQLIVSGRIDSISIIGRR